MAFTERERQIMVGVDLEPQTADEGALQAFAESCQEGDGGSSLPDVSGTDNGDVLTVVEGAWAKAAPPTELPDISTEGDGKSLMTSNHQWIVGRPGIHPYTISGTADPDTGVITFAQTTASILAANCEERPVKANITIGGSYVVMTFWVTYQFLNSQYDFSMIAPDGTGYASGHLAASDPVVMQPVST